MRLQRVKRVLLAHAVAREELVVVGIEGYRGASLQNPGAERLGYAHFRPECPAVGADVDQLGVVVLSRGCGYSEARADDRVLLIIAELLERKSRRAEQV